MNLRALAVVLVLARERHVFETLENFAHPRRRFRQHRFHGHPGVNLHRSCNPSMPTSKSGDDLIERRALAEDLFENAERAEGIGEFGTLFDFATSPLNTMACAKLIVTVCCASPILNFPW